MTRYSWLGDAAGLDQVQLDESKFTDISNAWDVVTSISGLTMSDLADRVALFAGTTAVAKLEPQSSTVQLLPESVARQLCVIPLSSTNSKLVIATSDPVDPELLHQASFISGRSIECVIASPELIKRSIEEKYKESGELAAVAQMKSTQKDTLLVRGRSTVSVLTQATGATEKLFLLILKEAVNREASDIHIQPFVGGAAVRFRIDGVMQQIKSMPLSVNSRLIRHVKSLADLDVVNDRIPQDGRLTMISNDVQRDLRVSVLPVDQGERLVVRLLSHAAAKPQALNFEESQASILRRSIRSSSGLILVTGPTGSGKTSTLYAFMNELNHDRTNIMSVEDPVEIRMSGVSQSTVHPEQGLSFPSVLRSMLRQDPDVILVGEIRDSETSELALRAALTGHLVLSTLHTIDAVTTIPRLMDLGLSPVLIADALLMVVNQRLVRKLCANCKESANSSTANDLESLYLQLSGQKQVWRAVGCETCSNTGFKGRLPVTQVWNITDDIRLALRQGNTGYDHLSEIAFQHGLRNFTDAGRVRIDAGDTTVEETVRVIGSGFWSAMGSDDHSILEVAGKTAKTSMREKILIIENDTEFRVSLTDALKSREYIVTAVATISEALDEIEKGYPLDLLLLDVENEERSPMRTLLDLEGQLYLAGLSSVLLLPSESEAVETLLDTYGASDYMIKPASSEHIADMVEKVLRRRHM